MKNLKPGKKLGSSLCSLDRVEYCTLGTIDDIIVCLLRRLGLKAGEIGLSPETRAGASVLGHLPDSLTALDRANKHDEGFPYDAFHLRAMGARSQDEGGLFEALSENVDIA